MKEFMDEVNWGGGGMVQSPPSFIHNSLFLQAPCSHEPVTNMISANNCTIVKLYNSIVLTMELNTYFTCENDEAVVQRVTPPPAPLPSRPVPTSSWRNLYPNQS